MAAAALDASFFRDFVAVEKEAISESTLEVNGEIIVSKDFLSTRRIHVGMTDFTLTEQTPSAQRVR
jgi:hypothetical protein